MGVVIPSILVGTRHEIERKLALIAGHVDVVQVDIVDGVLASPPTWPFTEGGTEAFPQDWDIHQMGDFRYEIDLMVREPRAAMQAFLKAGAGKLIIHVESTDNVGALIDELEQTYGRDKELMPELLSLGLSIRINTDMTLLEPHLPRVDYVQFMGIASIGQQGIPFDDRVVAKIREFVKKHPDMPTQVDGGVSLTTAPALLAAGVNRLVVGSAIWRAHDVIDTLHQFEELAQQYGRYQ